MLFPTVQFAIFFVVVFTGNWLLMHRPRPWRWFILAASYFFYGFWDWRFTVPPRRRHPGQPVLRGAHPRRPLAAAPAAGS